MFYAIVAGKIWSMITFVTKDNVHYSFAIVFSLFLIPLVSLLKSKSKTKSNDEATEVPEMISNYLSTSILNQIFQNHDIRLHSVASRIIIKKNNKWHLSVFMAKIETENEVLMLTCEFDLNVSNSGCNDLEITSVKSLHRCTSETTEIEEKIKKCLDRFKLSIKADASNETQIQKSKRKLFIHFQDVSIPNNSQKFDFDQIQFTIKNGKQQIFTHIGEMKNGVFIFEDFEPNLIKFKALNQSNSISINSRIQILIQIKNIKLKFIIYTAFGEKEIESIERLLQGI